MRMLPWAGILAAGLTACGGSESPPAQNSGGSAGAGVSGSGGQSAGSGGQSAGSGGTGGASAGSGGGGVAGTAGAETGGGGEGGAEPGPDLAVLSFNLRYGNADDGDDSWPNRTDLVFGVIADVLADSVGIQEGLLFQLEELDAEFPEYDRVGVGRNDGEESGEFAAIFYKTARLSVVDTGTFWFSDDPEEIGSIDWGANLPRICTWALFEEQGTGRRYYHYNLHIDHESEEARVNSARLVMERIAARAEQDTLVVLTGDFNTGEETLPIQYILGAAMIEDSQNALPLLDSFRVVNPDEVDVGTFNGFTGESTGAKIDYVFSLPNLVAIEAEIIRDNDLGRYPSDHFPVRAVFDGVSWQ